MKQNSEVLVADVCTLIVDCINRTAPVVENKTDFRMIRTTNIKGGRIDLSTCRYVSEETFNKWTRRAKVLDGDVLLTREAPIGEVGYVDALGDVFLGQRIMQYRPDPKKIEPRYLYYAFRSRELQNQFKSHEGSGSVVSHIRVADCHKFKVPLPSKTVQKSIADSLGALDDKIENNRRMNETLENMAQAIFKSWFVDFDPVHAKAIGNSPAHMEIETAQMFPNSFDENGLPLGWTKKCISDLAFRVTDKFKKDQSWDNEKLIDLGRMPSNSIALNDYGEGKELSTSINIFQKDDFLFGSIRPYFCKAGIAPFNGVTNSSVFILRCYDEKDSAFLYALCSSQNIFKKSVQFSKGTKMPAISWSDFSMFEFVNPSEKIKAKFSAITLPMYKKIQSNVAESETLVELRDTLLPKLMSGEIQVKDAKREVEAAV